MNINICQNKCKRAFFPDYIRFDSDTNKYYFCMEYDNFHNYCQEMEIEACPKFFHKNNNGWYLDKDFLNYEFGNSEFFLFNIHIKDTCPFIAEHTLSDINHENKIKKWKEHELKKKNIRNKIK